MHTKAPVVYALPVLLLYSVLYSLLNHYIGLMIIRVNLYSTQVLMLSDLDRSERRRESGVMWGLDGSLRWGWKC